MRTVAIIPARGGSKRIPGKNIKKLAGKPLISYAIEAALGAKSIGPGNVYVSTEDDEIEAVARYHGAQIIRRPLALATDTASSDDALLHASWEVPADAYAMLQATSPLTRASDIDAAVAKLEEHAACCSAVSCPSMFFRWIVDEENQCCQWSYRRMRRPRTQELAMHSYETGAIYAVRADALARSHNRLGEYLEDSATAILIPKERAIDIDDEFDWRLAEALIEGRI